MLPWCSVRKSRSCFCLPRQRQGCMQLQSNAIKLLKLKIKQMCSQRAWLEWKCGLRRLSDGKKSVECFLQQPRSFSVSGRCLALNKHPFKWETDQNDVLWGASQHYQRYFKLAENECKKRSSHFLMWLVCCSDTHKGNLQSILVGTWGVTAFFRPFVQLYKFRSHHLTAMRKICIRLSISHLSVHQEIIIRI